LGWDWSRVVYEWYLPQVHFGQSRFFGSTTGASGTAGSSRRPRLLGERAVEETGATEPSELK